MNENVKSTKISGVDCAIGRNKRTPSTVSMNVSDTFVIEAVQLYKALKTGEKPKEGLIGLELHAVYAEDLNKIDSNKEKLAKNLLTKEHIEPSKPWPRPEQEEAETLIDGMEKELDLSEGEEKK